MDVSHSIFSPEYICEFLQEIYDLKLPLNAEFIRSGINDTYKVNSKNRSYYFRLSSPNRIYENRLRYYESEIIIWETIAELGIPTLKCVKTKNSQNIVTLHSIEGNRVGILTEELVNQGMDDHFDDPKFWKEVGNILGSIHISIQNPQKIERPNFDCDLLFTQFLSGIIKHASPFPTEMNQLMSKISKLQDIFEEFCKLSSTGILQGDFSTDNLVMVDGKIGIVDFDFSWNGPQLFDVLTMASILELIFNDKKGSYVNAFFEGYSIHSEIAKSFISNIKKFKALVFYYYLGIWGLKINQFSSAFILDGFKLRLGQLLEMF